MRKSRLSKEKQFRLLEHFVSGSTARCTAELVDINPKTAAYYFHRLREIIFLEAENEAMLSGEFEIDESYFGGTRKGKRGRGAARKEIPIAYEGEDVAVGLNAKYVLDVLNVIEDKEIVLNLKDQNHSCLITVENDKD